MEASENVPCGHGVHSVAPADVENVPGGHVLQTETEELPTDDELVPGGHSAQFIAAWYALYDPGKHGTHSDCAGFSA